MAPAISIIIPHKPTKANDISLRMNLEMLLANTVNSFELIIDTECPKDPYRIWNDAAPKARGEILIFTNSDVLMAPGWDAYMVKYCQPNTIVTGYLVEPGNIGVASQNFQADFGKTPAEFNRSAFEIAMQQRVKFEQEPEAKEERGWYMPCAMNRVWFEYTGGFDTTLGFPNPNDIIFWEHCIKEFQTRLIRVRSYAYHFQNLSGR
jgi:hypothetical protein